MGPKGILALCWKIGIGAAILVRDDTWILRNPNYKIQQTITNQCLQTLVDLIDPRLRTWREGIVRSIFNEVKAQRILSIPLT